MDMKKLAIGAALLFAAAKYVTNGTARGAMGSIGAIIIAKQIPVVKDLI